MVNVSEHRLRVLTVKTTHVHLMDEEAEPKEQGLTLLWHSCQRLKGHACSWELF